MARENLNVAQLCRTCEYANCPPIRSLQSVCNEANRLCEAQKYNSILPQPQNIIQRITREFDKTLQSRALSKPKKKALQVCRAF